jgi:tRNA dimethylallyltransferase
MSKIKKKVIAIVGPTASGKTSFGVRLAKEFNGEIISADSRQVYRGLDLGTGKDLDEYDGVPYHLIDIADPEEKMTLFDYLPLAREAIADVLSRGKLPIIVGGTGLYVQGIVEGFELQVAERQSVGVAEYSRQELDGKTVKELNEILDKIDPDKNLKVDRKNAHRLIRAIEMAQEGLTPVKIKPDFEVLQIGIDLPRDVLHEKIDKRVDTRFAEGMLEEVEGLIDRGVSTDWLIELGLEYRIMTEYILSKNNGQISNIKYQVSHKVNNDQIEQPGFRIKSGMTEQGGRPQTFEEISQDLKFKSHQFARRQMTWFRRFPEINWLSDYDQIKRFVKIFITH